jgi:hypothetical protein
MTSVVAAIGAVCFGLTVGYLTYRTLVRAEKTVVSDLSSVIAAVGGGAVTKLYDPRGDLFGWYAIGLAAGLAAYALVFAKLNGKDEASRVLGGRTGRREPAPAEDEHAPHL